MHLSLPAEVFREGRYDRSCERVARDIVAHLNVRLHLKCPGFSSVTGLVFGKVQLLNVLCDCFDGLPVNFEQKEHSVFLLKDLSVSSRVKWPGICGAET